MVSCITASIELATLPRDDLTYLPQSFLLNRADADLRYPIEIPDPASGRFSRKDLIPDALFALEYHTSEGSRYRAFLVEADRSTEPATSSNFNRKSWRRNLAQYSRYIGEGLYRVHLKLKSPMLVLNVVTDENRVAQISRLVEAEAPDLGRHMLMQMWDDFGPVFAVPKPRVELLGGRWQRAGDIQLRID